MPTARIPIDAAHRAATSDAHPIGAVTGLDAALAGKEPSLGNPASDGLVLSSTLAGVRSWAEQPRERVLKSVTALSTDHAATWTADPATDTLTASAAHGLTVSIPIAFSHGTGALPGGLSPEPEYYYVVAVPTTTTLKVSLTRGGTAIDITSPGTAGWVVKTLPSFSDTSEWCSSGIISLKDAGSLTMILAFVSASRYGNGQYPRLSVYPSTVDLYGSVEASTYGPATNLYYMLALRTSGRKYNRCTESLTLTMIDDKTARGTFTLNEIGADDAAFTTNLAYMNHQVGFFMDLSVATDITNIAISDGYSGWALSGATSTVIAAAR